MRYSSCNLSDFVVMNSIQLVMLLIVDMMHQFHLFFLFVSIWHIIDDQILVFLCSSMTNLQLYVESALIIQVRVSTCNLHGQKRNHRQDSRNILIASKNLVTLLTTMPHCFIQYYQRHKQYMH